MKDLPRKQRIKMSMHISTYERRSFPGLHEKKEITVRLIAKENDLYIVELPEELHGYGHKGNHFKQNNYWYVTQRFLKPLKEGK